MEHPQKTSPKKRRGPPSRAAVLRWVLAAIACSGVLAYFPSVCSAVFLALLVLLVPIGPLEKRLAQFAPRLRRVRTAAIAALFLLAACIAPRETGGARRAGARYRSGHSGGDKDACRGRTGAGAAVRARYNRHRTGTRDTR